MKRIFKYICRKVDEKVAKTINSVNECINNVNECINTVSDKMKNKEDVINLAIITGCAGVGLLSFSACMFIKIKTM